MFRSILKGSFLAASLAASLGVIALSSTANATANSKSSLSMSGDVNLKETSAGRAYAADKKSGATCPFATKGNRDDVTTIADAGSGAVSGGYSNGKTTVH